MTRRSRTGSIASDRSLRPAGLVVAGVGFAITRTFVAAAIQPSTVQYLITGVVPLVVGLAVTTYGVALTVGAYPKAYVRTITGWMLAGTVGMSLVLVTSVFDAMSSSFMLDRLGNSRVLVANVLLGGAVGGVLIGRRAAHTQRQREEIERQANRARLVTRILRHEVVNAATIVDGYASTLVDGETADGESVSAIRESADRIVETVEDVGDITDEPAGSEVDVVSTVTTALDGVRGRYDDVTYERTISDDGSAHPDRAATTTPAANRSSDGTAPSAPDATESPSAASGTPQAPDATAPNELLVQADERLGIVVRELLENAAENGATRVETTVWTTPNVVCISVADDGSGLPAAQCELLEAGVFPEYDDPTSGFGLKVVRLLVRTFDGRLAVTDGLDGSGTTVTVEFPRAQADFDRGTATGLTASTLQAAVTAGVVAGVAMGGFFALTNDVLPVIGSLYGVQNPLVGWITHLFHSVVFALAFVPGYVQIRHRTATSSLLAGSLSGMAWGVILWFVAAGIVMPLWLQSVGVQAMFPNLPRIGLVAHVLWGLVLGGTYVALER